MNIKVRDLKQTEKIENSDKLMVLVDDDLNLVKNITKEELVTNVISSSENNALVQNPDGNLYVNTSEITEKIGDLNDLTTKDKTTLVSAINEINRGSNVNSLNLNQITNCILEAPNGVATFTAGSNVVTVKQGLKVLCPNGRNADGTLNNLEYTLAADVGKTIENAQLAYQWLASTGEIDEGQNYTESAEQPLTARTADGWYNPDENKSYRYDGTQWIERPRVLIDKVNRITGGVVQALYPNKPVELVKQTDIATKLNQISNCFLEIPENIHYEINSAGRIILKAGSKVYVSTNGTFEAVTLNTNTPEGANELWTQDHSRRLFVVYIPETNRVQAHALDYTYAQTTAPTTFLTGYALWYNTDTKVIKATVDSGATWRICSLPIMIGRPGGTNIGWRGYVDNVFNGMGFISQYSFVLPNVRVLFADRRNANGTLKNKEIVSDVVHFQSLVNQTSQLGRLMFRNNALMLGGYGVTNYFEQETVPSGFGQHAVWYNTRENQVYVTGDSGTTWTKTYEIVLPKLTKGSVTSAITDISMPYPLKIGDVNINMPALKSANGYTRLPNGIIVQWGTLPSSGDPATVTISFPIPFSNNQYGFVATPRMTTNYNDWSFGWVTKNTTNCTMFCKTQGQAISWIVVGY